VVSDSVSVIVFLGNWKLPHKLNCNLFLFADSLLAKMTGSGKGRKRKEKQEKREFPDGEINVTAIMPGAQRTREDGGA
jgi:hypothetical protein